MQGPCSPKSKARFLQYGLAYFFKLFIFLTILDGGGYTMAMTAQTLLFLCDLSLDS